MTARPGYARHMPPSCRSPRHALCAGLALLGSVLGCSGALATEPEPPTAPGAAFVPCTDPRPEMCTQHFDPVCGELRCAEEPCEERETRTYSNGCMACSDPQVVGYRRGACPEPGRSMP